MGVDVGQGPYSMLNDNRVTSQRQSTVRYTNSGAPLYPNGCWQPTHKRPLFPYINWGLDNQTVGAGRLTYLS